jgi:sodium/bile acid cotransporter 7
MALLSRIIPDRFIWVLIGAIALASLLPVRGSGVATANLVSSGAVFLIFLLHGIRLPRAQVVEGLRNWRVQGSLTLFIFALMPLAGWIISTGLAHWLPPMVALGFIYLGVLPTTVQSATTYTSLARGNVAISVVASALNNLGAIIITPLLFTLIAGGSGGGEGLSADLGIRIASILLLPFIIGQSVQAWARPWALAHGALIKFMDQSAIAIAVFVAFSAAVVDGIWGKLSGGDYALLMMGVALFLTFAFAGARHMGRLLGVNHADGSAIIFAGAHKSIAVGAPLAALLFPAHTAGMVLLPVLIYHMAQLILSAWIAPLRAKGETGETMLR